MSSNKSQSERQAQAIRRLDYAFKDSHPHYRDPLERARRFIEEAAEVVQTVNLPKEEIFAIVNHVYSKPVGEPKVEVGQAILTLEMFASSLPEPFIASYNANRAYKRFALMSNDELRSRYDNKIRLGLAK